MSKSVWLKISGMSCVNCSNAVEKVSKKTKGVLDANVSFVNANGEFVVSDEFDESALVAKIEKLGYKVSKDESEFEAANEQNLAKLKKRFFVAAAATSVLMVVEHFFMGLGFASFVMFLMASITQFYSGFGFYVGAIKAFKSKNSDMNTLVALGSSAAYLYSFVAFLFPNLFPSNLNYLYFGGSSMIITFLLLGKLLELKSKQKATDYLKKLMDLSPEMSIVLDSLNNESEVLSKDLKIGDIVLIKAGERISCDGKIISGNAEIDNSMLSGESMLEHKTKGDEVNAGTYNKNGILKVEVTKLAQNTTLSQIINLLEFARSQKMPIASLADKVANIFVPSVVGISILTLILWLIFDGSFLHATLAAVSVLIISCPCALGLATPIAIVSALWAGARQGILVKNPQVLELMKEAKFAIFDKTGTLTKGEISVCEAKFKSQDDLNKIAKIAQKSEHLISRSIYKFIGEQSLNEEIEFELIVGKGVKGRIGDDEVLIGSFDFLDSFGVKFDDEFLKFSENAKEKGIVYASVNLECRAIFILKDSLKDEAKETIKTLQDMQIEPIMLTGDNENTAKNVAHELGIKKIYAKMLPQDKFHLLQDLQKEAKVIFVGDGINDSPSLKQADIGIALSSGSDIAKEAGDIVLINNNLKDVIKAIRLSEISMRLIRQNLFWAFFYNILGIPLAAGALYPHFGILLSPVYAGIAMSFSSVMVVLNSLRLRLIRL